MEYFLEGRLVPIKGLVSQLKREDLYLSSCTNSLSNSKWGNFVYVFTEIYLQWSKWFCPRPWSTMYNGAELMGALAPTVFLPRPEIIHISVPLFCPAPKLYLYLHPCYLVQFGASDYVHSQVLVSLGNSFIIFMVEYTYRLRWVQCTVVLPNYATVSFILNQTCVSIFLFTKNHDGRINSCNMVDKKFFTIF